MQGARDAIRVSIIFGAGLVALLGAAICRAQQPNPLPDLARCAAITTDAARLACFDALARELGLQNGTERAAVTPDEDESSDVLMRADNEDAFGAELLGARGARGPDEIESRLIGEFTGWRGNTTFSLENGQVWRQAEEGRLVFRADAPLVTIRRAAFGTYRLSVEGVNRAVRVRRVE